jgi:nucleotide-binding universal stress UspA family protein
VTLPPKGHSFLSRRSKELRLIGCLPFGVALDTPANQLGGHTVPNHPHGVAVFLQEMEDGFRARGVAVRSSVSRGDPAIALLEAAMAQHADLVVMATDGRAPLEAFWSGSLTPKVMETIESPLLLVRADPETTSRRRER